MTTLSRIFEIVTALFVAIVSANSYNPAAQRDYQQYVNYRQLQQRQQQDWRYSYPTENLHIPYQVEGMQPKAASNQQQHQPLAALRQTWSGAPIVVDYVDDNNDAADIVQDIDVEQQSVQLTQTAAAAAAQTATTLQSRQPQTFNDAFVPYKQQLPQQAFHFQTKAAYPVPQTLHSLYKSGPPTESLAASYSRQARLLPFSTEEAAAMNLRVWQRPWVVKSTTSLVDHRAPALLGTERLQRFAAYAPFFERYVKKYPRRLVPQRYPASKQH